MGRILASPDNMQKEMIHLLETDTHLTAALPAGLLLNVSSKTLPASAANAWACISLSIRLALLTPTLASLASEMAASSAAA